mgnify:CR=1 FL=1
MTRRGFAPSFGGTATAGAEGAAPGGDMGAGAPPPPGPEAGGEPPIPESTKKERNRMILETKDDDFDEDEFLSFQRGNSSLGDVESELSKLLGD